MKTKIKLDLYPETHRQGAKDCICPYCNKEESKEFIDNQNKKVANEFLELQERWGKINSEIGGLS